MGSAQAKPANRQFGLLSLLLLLPLLLSSPGFAQSHLDEVDPPQGSADETIEAGLIHLERELSIAVLDQQAKQTSDPEAAQRLRNQGLALWAAAPNLQARSRVLMQLQQWGLLSRLPDWNPDASGAVFPPAKLPAPPNKAWIESNTNFDRVTQPLVVHFWARWCGPCRRELPQLAQFYREHYLALAKAGIELVTVNNDPVLASLSSEPLSPALAQLPVLHDPNFKLYRQLAQSHEVALPATFLLQPGQPHRVLAYGPMEWLAPGVTENLQALAQQP